MDVPWTEIGGVVHVLMPFEEMYSSSICQSSLALIFADFLIAMKLYALQL